MIIDANIAVCHKAARFRCWAYNLRIRRFTDLIFTQRYERWTIESIVRVKFCFGREPIDSQCYRFTESPINEIIQSDISFPIKLVPYPVHLAYVQDTGKCVSIFQ